MGLLRDVTDVLGATGLALGGYALPLGLGVLGALATPTIPLVEDPAAHVAEARLLPAPDLAPTEPAALVDAAPAPVSAVAEAAPVALAKVASDRARTLQRPGTDEAEPAPRPEPDGVAAAKTEPKQTSCEPRTDDIVRVGSTTFAIERELITYFVTHPTKLNGLGYVKRHHGDDGKVEGFRLGGIKCGSELHLAGLRNGDVVRTVNGRRITSIPEAFLTYAKLKNTDVIEIVVERKGEIQRLVYRLG